MTVRPFVSLLLVATLGLALAGCGSTAEVATPIGKTSESSSSGGSSGGSPGGSSEGSSGGSSDTVPDLGSLSPLLGEECAKAASVYFSGIASAFASPEEAKQIQDELDKVKGQVPSNIADDIAVVTEVFSSMATDGFIVAGQKMDSPEFKKASDELNAYFENGCKGN